MLAMAKSDSKIVWGDKAIQEALESVIGFRPSKTTLRKWADPKKPNPLPIRRLDGSNRKCADVVDLKKWAEKNLK